MNIEEMGNKIIELRSEAYDLEQKIAKGVSNYVDAVYGTASCNDPASKDKIGLICKEEIAWHYDKQNNVIGITYNTFRNAYGDLNDDHTIYVNPSVIDKYCNV